MGLVRWTGPVYLSVLVPAMMTAFALAVSASSSPFWIEWTGSSLVPVPVGVPVGLTKMRSVQDWASQPGMAGIWQELAPSGEQWVRPRSQPPQGSPGVVPSVQSQGVQLRVLPQPSSMAPQVLASQVLVGVHWGL